MTALTISKLKMWKDPGYTRGCVEVPPAGSKKLPSVPDYVLTSGQTLRPHKGSTLTSLQLPLAYTQLFGMSYLYIEASDGVGTVSLFGWIDSVTQMAVSEANTQINWTVDWWRSYSGSATFGAGQITKCSDSTYKRPYRTHPRYWKATVANTTPLCEDNNNAWTMIYLVAVFTVSGVSTIRYFEFPAFNAGHISFTLPDHPNDTYYTMSIQQCYKGLIDELLTDYCDSLTPKPSFEIIGCYASQIKNPLWITGATWRYNVHGDAISGDVNGSTYSMMEVDGGISAVYGITFNPSIMTDDMTQYAIVDYWGNPVGNLPYGVSVTKANITLDIGVNGAYEKVIFESDAFDGQANQLISAKATKMLGLEFSIPCITIPITSNQWSSYLLGGQRDYDITSARIANDQKGVSGLESTIQAGIGGGVTGSTAGPLGAIGGLLGGMIAEGGMTAIQYGLGKNFNDQLQDAADRLYSNQKNNILIPGGSRAWYDRTNTLNKSWGAYLIKLEADTVSAAEYTADITNNGYDTNIPVASSASFVTAGGPLRITQLIITGGIPPEAKQAIKGMLETGVRIVENNPSGVAP